MTSSRAIQTLALLLAVASCDVPERPEPVARVEGASLVDPSFWAQVNAITSAASKATDDFSKVKNGFDVLKQVGALLGLWNIDDPLQKLQAIIDLVNKDDRAIDWTQVNAYIDTYRAYAATAINDFKRTGVASSSNDDETAMAVNGMVVSEVPYLRIADESVTDGTWKQVIRDRQQPITNGKVYDWRLGVPAFMQLIAYRIAVIASLDQNFRWDRVYGPELQTIRQQLEWNYVEMLDGIRCATTATGPWVHYCADINTGLFVTATSPAGGASQSSEVIRATLASQLQQKMPLFAVRQMIDTLNLYIAGTPDLTESSGQISSAGAQNLCVEVPGGGSLIAAPLQVNPCNGTAGQKWSYDRSNAKITNTFGWCLDVNNGDVMQQTGPLPLSSNPIRWPIAWTYTCNGTAAQQWTYDPASQLLRNALGTALDIQWGNLAVQTRQPVAGTYGQLWRDDQPFTFQPAPPAACGRLNPGEGLSVGQGAGSCNGRFLLSLRSDGNVDLQETIHFNWATFTVKRWETSTSASTGDVLVMQGDGNLVLYNATGGPVWSTNTWGHDGAHFEIQDSGDLALIGPAGNRLWATTAQNVYREHKAPPSLLWHNPTTGELSAWALDEYGDVTGHQSLSWICDAASGCSQAWSVVGTGDLNADGNVDVLWRHSNGTLSAWLLDPHGAVTRSLNLSRTCDPRTCAAGNPVGLLDLDGDGLTDLLWHNPGTGAVTAWLLDNAGTVIGDRSLSWQCGQSDACSSSWRIVGTMDANGDGKRDLLWHNATTGQLSAWLLDKDVTGTQDLSWTCTRATGCADSWQVVGAGDFNGDVNADLLWFNRQTGESSVWLTDGHGRVTGSESLSIRCDGTPINAPLTTFSGCSQAWNPVGLVGVR